VTISRANPSLFVGCGAQGLNQGLNMRDSGLNVRFALRTKAIEQQNDSYQRARAHDFDVGVIEDLIPKADLVLNLTPDKQHAKVIAQVEPLMKQGACLAYSHGFNIVEEGQRIREDLTVIMVAPKCPGTEVREEYKRGFGVPTLIAVHPENDPQGQGLEIAKAYCAATGGDRAGVLESSFVAEVKSDLMGEQTILCGMQQVGALLGYEHLIEQGHTPESAAELIQYGWEVVTEALKVGGVTLMLDRLAPAARLRASKLADELKQLLRPVFEKHMADILSGEFSRIMIEDWHNDDAYLLNWREQVAQSAFEKAPAVGRQRKDQRFFDEGIFIVAMIKAGVELAFDVMIESGIELESAYYESLHETPLIANTIARKRLYEMNKVISDTAEYGSYVFTETALPLIKAHILPTLKPTDLGQALSNDVDVDNRELLAADQSTREQGVEQIGAILRDYMRVVEH
jgi:ketol-acid reductoisomerase